MAPEHAAHLGQAFGVAVEASFTLPRLPGASSPNTLPRVQIEVANTRELKRAWPTRDAEETLRRSRPGNRLVMLVERHPEAGYSVWAPRFGRHLVSSDGSRIRSAVPRIPAWRWERLLFAQALPLASALRGRELFHASAVALNGRIVAFVGPSGAGKSSIAAHLVDRGATLVTDDVLALGLEGGEVVAHPGARLVGLDRRELATMSSHRFDARLGQADKTYVDMHVASGPGRLAALYFLTMGGSSVEIEQSGETAARLLGASFLAYLDDPEQLLRHLDLCAAIARDVPTFDVLRPRASSAEAVARTVEAHLERGGHGV